jgi:hypothetical protein
MYFEIFKDENDKQYIHIELTKNDVNYLLKEKSLADFDGNNKIRLEMEDETKDMPLDGNYH